MNHALQTSDWQQSIHVYTIATCYIQAFWAVAQKHQPLPTQAVVAAALIAEPTAAVLGPTWTLRHP